MKKKAILSLCDYTGLFCADWVEAGFEAILVDPQHGKTRKENGYIKLAGTIVECSDLIRQFMDKFEIVFVAGFPPCTDVAVSGTRHFDSKIKNDALVWAKSVMVAEQCRMIGLLCGCPWFFENPVSILANSELFGKPKYFHPFEYGGYLEGKEKHPLYSEWINDSDAYTKKTGLWCGGGFDLPDKRPVAVPNDEAGKSKQYSQLGGDSLKTKNIRSATPRGFSRAVFEKYSVDRV